MHSTAPRSSGSASLSALSGTGAQAQLARSKTLRGVVVELQVAPIRHAVNIAMEPFLGILQKGRALNDYDYLVQARDVMFDHLVWWGETLKGGPTKAAESNVAD